MSSKRLASSLPEQHPVRLLRLKQVLEIFPVSRTCWYQGIKKGIYPKPLSLGEKSVAWLASDIYALIESFKVKGA